MKSVIIGLVAAILVGALAIIVVLWLPCRAARKRRKALAAAQAAARAAADAAEGGSPGPSVKSLGSKELDGNESDEKNPDIIPDTMDSDDQVGLCEQSNGLPMKPATAAGPSAAAANAFSLILHHSPSP